MAQSLHDRAERSDLRLPQPRPPGSRRKTRGLWIRLGGDVPPVILGLLVLLLPLLVVSAASRRWHGAGTALFEAGAVGLLISALWQARDLKAVWARARCGPLLWLLGLVVWSALSAARAPDKRFALMGLLETGAGVAVCLAAARLRSTRLKAVVDIWLGVTLLAALLTVCVTATALDRSGDALTSTHSHPVLSGTTHLVRRRTPTETVRTAGQTAAGGGTFGDSHFVEAFFVQTLPLLFAFALRRGRAAPRLLAGSAVALGLTALALTQSLGLAWPALITSLILLGAFSLGDLRPLLRRWKRAQSEGRARERAARRQHAARRPQGRLGRAAALTQEAAARLPLLSLATGLIVLVLLTWAVSREWRGFQPAALSRHADSQAGARANATAVERIEARPLLGWGPAAFPLWAGGEAAVRARGATLGDQAPDFYAQTAAERGLPGLLLWLGALGAICAGGLRALRGLPAESQRRPVLAGGLAAVGGWAVDALANPAWEYGQAQFFLWLMLGLILAGTDGPGMGEEVIAGVPMCYNKPTRFLFLLLLGGGMLALIARTLPILPRMQG